MRMQHRVVAKARNYTRVQGDYCLRLLEVSQAIQLY